MARCVWHWLFEKSTIKLNKPHWSTLFFINCAPTRLGPPRLDLPRLESPPSVACRVELSLSGVQAMATPSTSAKQKSRAGRRLGPVCVPWVLPLLLLLLAPTSSSVLWAFDRRLSNSPCNLHTLKTGQGARDGSGVEGFPDFGATFVGYGPMLLCSAVALQLTECVCVYGYIVCVCVCV